MIFLFSFLQNAIVIYVVLYINQKFKINSQSLVSHTSNWEKKKFSFIQLFFSKDFNIKKSMFHIP